MTIALVAAVSVAAAVAARPPAVEQPLTARRYQSVSEAVDAALQGNPVVVAFGELHQTRATASIPSALHRFTQQVLPPLASRLSRLVVETWVTTGRCGETERAVTEDLRKTTDRPAATESEIETLIRAVVAGGIVPRILSISCADYGAMRPAGQPVDYDRTLKITARALEIAVLAALRERWRAAPEFGGGAPRPFVGVYGGALHNDVHPDPELFPYSFATAVMAATLGRYVEIDLVVPEYATGNALIRAQATAAGWWKPYLRSRRPGAAVLIRRSSKSFVIVFPAGSRAR